MRPAPLQSPAGGILSRAAVLKMGMFAGAPARLEVAAVRCTYDDFAERGRRAQDYRSSAANAGRRERRGEIVVRCPVCGCELDVREPAHDFRCSVGKAAA